MGTILHLNRTGPHNHLNRTKEEAEGTAACRRRRRCARFGSFGTQEGIPGLVRGKRDKSNIIYQKLIKNRHPDKIKSAFSNI
jgi:hypothetical protein